MHSAAICGAAGCNSDVDGMATLNLMATLAAPKQQKKTRCNVFVRDS
jgi:hypothetical protein